jgi:PBP1b-binding outer membrane lipoprotein LpoB
MKKIIAVLTSMIILFGCSKKVQTVDYYVSHKDELTQVLKSCETEQGAAQDQNCINATTAENKNMMSQMSHANPGL